MTVLYEPSHVTEATVLFRWRGTVLPRVLGRPTLWFLVLFHGGLVYLRLYRDDIPLPPLPGRLLALPSLLLVLFLASYCAHCFARYYSFYSSCTGMSGCVMAWVGLLRVHFPAASAVQLWNLSRLLVASVYLLYFHLAERAAASAKLVTEQEWMLLAHTQLLSDEEVARLKAYRGFQPFLCQIWALRAIMERLEADPRKDPAAVIEPFQSQVLTLRGHCDDIVTARAQPIPLAYFHTVTLLLSLNLLMTGYSMVEVGTEMTVPVFFVVCLFFLAIKETAVALSDPFGGSDLDFNTDMFLASILSNTKAMLSSSANYVSTTLQLPSMKMSHLSA
ncbi:hypothetical protein AB1Y20_002978 [Prymnesium parvum]|uniref:Bestrophin homolog n=1 Tax=Prymnesium parvum TaxID=97485 RepID=A0AB34JAP5_PRYPA